MQSSSTVGSSTHLGPWDLLVARGCLGPHLQQGSLGKQSWSGLAPGSLGLALHFSAGVWSPHFPWEGQQLQPSNVSSEKEMAPHSSILAWRIPWTVARQAPLSMGSQELDPT